MIQTRDVRERSVSVTDIQFGAVHQHFDDQSKRFFDDGIQTGVVLFGGHKGDVNVGIGAQFGAPVAADGDQNQIVGRGVAAQTRRQNGFPGGGGDAL